MLLVTVDSLRPDHMSLYGYPRQTTPHLDALAGESLVFDQAIATGAWTSPGVVSALTGYAPPVHGQNSRHSWYDPEMTAPLRLLARRRYLVAGYTDDGPTYAHLGLGSSLHPYASLEEVVDFNADRTRPFFAWVHLKETHLPYDPPPEHLEPWGVEIPDTETVRVVREHGVVFRRDHDQVPFSGHPGEVELDPADAPAVRALYDGKVHQVDARLGRALARMRESGLLDRTVVVVTADHGEELLDHGWVGHASTSYDAKLYDELIRIPLVIRIPGGPTGRHGALVQQTDILPTLLDVLDLDASGLEPALQGRSLLPLARGEVDRVRDHAFSSTTLRGWTTPRDLVPLRLVSVRTLDRKLVREPGEGEPRYRAFDLEADPGERRDLWPEEAERFQDLVRALEEREEADRGVAAALVLGAARRHLAAMEEALGRGDVEEVLHRQRLLVRLHRAREIEPDPFFRHPPWDEEWASLRRRAGDLAREALRIDRRELR